jgi:hypothetical protein
MKKLLSAALLILPIAYHPAFAETDQQNKMKTCNAAAADKKGDERKAFMKECLSKHDEKGSAAQQAQREKMKSCNAAAVDKQGDARKAFMKDCLSKH